MKNKKSIKKNIDFTLVTYKKTKLLLQLLWQKI